ncbi:fibrinogen-like protein 1 [Drosophila sulfurigaster albostrigata]|uniref:fibrinogen-like protein 1 n=1 Tax=Drosophila sulfurigaster albostrigata TaxID=89887 RepID=UPI002D21C040|nr:fibrinogen-like protein 1 [Drosophila sulfurigaster albostrigata]
MEKESFFIMIMLLLVIPWTLQGKAAVSSVKKKDPVKDCVIDTKNKTNNCQNTTALASFNQTVTPKPKLAEFQIEQRKTISITKDDLNDLLDVYMTKLAENAVAINEKEHEIDQLQSLNKTEEDHMKKYQELSDACNAQNVSFATILNEKDALIKNLRINSSIIETRLKRKQHFMSIYKKLNATNTATIRDLKQRVLYLEARLKERKDDLLADWEAATDSCLPHGKTFGIHLIQLPDFRPFLVPCDGSTVAGAGWTVIQRRLDGSVDFYRNWDEYRKGFGKLTGEFFIGLEKLHRLTTFQPHELYVSLKLFNGTNRYALYEDFVIGSEAEGYELKLLGHYHGDASDALRTHDKMKFSTYDRDHDEFTHMNCAERHHGAWWYDFCSRSNLNGKYFKRQTDDAQGIFWERWYSYQSLKSVQMLIRPKQS